MDKHDETTKIVETFDIEQAILAVSIQNLLSYAEMLKYLKSSRALSLLLVVNSPNPLSVLFSKQSAAKQGDIEGIGKGYTEALNLFKQAAKYSWDPAFTISNFANLYKNYEIKYKDAVVKNYSQSTSSFRDKYLYRSSLYVLIDTWEKYTRTGLHAAEFETEAQG